MNISNDSQIFCACYLLTRGRNKDAKSIIKELDFAAVSDYMFDHLCKFVVACLMDLSLLENEHKEISEVYKADVKALKKADVTGENGVLEGDYKTVNDLINLGYQEAVDASWKDEKCTS